MRWDQYWFICLLFCLLLMWAVKNLDDVLSYAFLRHFLEKILLNL